MSHPFPAQVAKFHMVDRLDAQSRAFVGGLGDVVDLALLRAHWPLPAVYFSLEAFCIGVFTLEIVAKLALAKRRLRLLMPLHRDGRAFWIDVAATATWYATVGPHSILAQRDVTSGRPNLAFLRLVRLFRVLRTLRLAHFSGVAVFTTALFESIPQLSALFFYLGILGVFMACMIHSFEADGPGIAAAALNASGCPADPRTLARALDDPSSRLNLFVSVCVVLSTLFFLLETSEEFLALLERAAPQIAALNAEASAHGKTLCHGHARTFWLKFAGLYS